MNLALKPPPDRSQLLEMYWANEVTEKCPWSDSLLEQTAAFLAGTKLSRTDRPSTGPLKHEASFLMRGYKAVLTLGDSRQKVDGKGGEIRRIIHYSN